MADVQLSTLGAIIKTAYEGEADTNGLTDALLAIVNAALIDSDFTEASGTLRKVSAGSYIAVVNNLGDTVPPTAVDDNTGGYAKGSFWIDSLAGKIYLCIDASTSAAIWQEVGAGGGSGGMTVTEIKTANYTAGINEVIPIDSSAGSFTITFPAGTPAAQSRIIVIDVGKVCDAYPVTLARNSNNFDGVAEDFVIDQDNGRVDASFDGTDDWALHLIGTPKLMHATQDVCLCTQTSAQTIAPATNVALSWDVAQGTRTDWWDSGDPTVITVDADGIYSVMACLETDDALAAPHDCISYIRKNGSTITRDRAERSYQFARVICTTAYFEAGDEIRFDVYHETAVGPVDSVISATRLSVQRVS